MILNRRNIIQKASVTAAGVGVFSILPTEFWKTGVAPDDKVNIA
jgi:hypothetical protein